MSGRFITVEGSDGSGKTTQITFIREHLEQVGYRVITTREPGGTALGEDIRTLLFHHKGIAATTETLLLFAARAEHLECVVLPALTAGDWVICDRFTDATYAYQGGGRMLCKEFISVLEDLVQGSLQPDLTLLFDVPVAVSIERVRKRCAMDRFEQETVGFFEKVRSIYLDRAARYHKRYRIVNASRSPAEVRIEVENLLTVWLEVLNG